MNNVPNHIVFGGASKSELMQMLAEHGVKMNAYADMLFQDDGFCTTTDKIGADLTMVRVKDLGFLDGATTADIYTAARERGMQVCPLELAPHLRLAFLDQELGPWIVIASEKLHDDETFPNGFYIQRREDGLWLRGYRAPKHHIWSPEDRFVFVKDVSSFQNKKTADAV